MSSSGKGLLVGVGKMRPAHLLPRTDVPSSAAPGVANDWVWGNTPPHAAVIPYSWLDQPLRFRPDAPVNIVDVSRTGGGTARSLSVTSRAEYGESPQQISLDTALDADLIALGVHIVGAYADPRMRCPELTFDLLQRTDPERWLILDRSEGDRIVISGAPATWPAGTTSLVIEGIGQKIGIDSRVVTWNTSPVVGTVAGTPGPWFRLNASRADGTDTLAF